MNINICRSFIDDSFIHVWKAFSDTVELDCKIQSKMLIDLSTPKQSLKHLYYCYKTLDYIGDYYFALSGVRSPSLWLWPYCFSNENKGKIYTKYDTMKCLAVIKYKFSSVSIVPIYTFQKQWKWLELTVYVYM